MLYYKCPTCKTLLANKQIVYEERLIAICNDNKMSDKDKLDSKKKLLDELDVIRPCCRMRLLGYVKLIDLIH